MPVSSISDVDRVCKIAALCYRDCDEAIAILEFLEAGNTHEAEAAFDRGNGHVPILVRKAMQQRLLMSVMRMYDDPARDRETLPRAFEFLDQSTVYQAVCNRGDKTRLDSAILRWKQIRLDPVLIEMRTVRNYELAHAIPSKAGKAQPRIIDFFCVARQTIVLVEELAAGGGVVNVSFEAVRELWTDRATAYWARLIATPCSKL